MAGEGEDEERSEEEEEEISYPTGKLAAITRKKNEISKLTADRIKQNVDTVTKLKTEFLEKISNFEEACQIQLAKKVSKETANDFCKWYQKHQRKYETFTKQIEIWLLNIQDDDDSDGDSDSDDDLSFRSTKNDPNTAEIMRIMVQAQAMAQLPRNEPESFSGEDITVYKTFILSFEKIIEERCSSDSDKFYYLLRYTKGEANSLVSSCHETDMTSGYDKARKLLETQYGNEYRIAQKYLDKLHGWDSIKSEDSNALRRFSAFLTECNNMMGKMSALNQLNSLRDIKEVVMKLPWDMRKRFRNIVQQRMQNNETVNFKILVDYVNEQSSLLQIPLLGDITDKKPKEKKPVTKQRTYLTNEVNQATKECFCCKKNNHNLDDCFFFKQKPVEAREDLIKKISLCFGCLKPGHRTKDCRNKLKCNVCQKLHPTSLHRTSNRSANNYREPLRTPTDQREEQRIEQRAERNINMVTREGTKTMCPAIPVILRAKDSGNSVITYMGLDNYSTATYMDHDLVKQLHTSTEDIKLKVTTIENSSSELKVAVANNIEVLSLDNSISISIPTVYAKKSWTFTDDDSPKLSDVKKLSPLENVPFQFINGKIGILVGMDMPEILKPLEITETTKHGPYASRHIFGWALNGPIKGSSNPHSCLRTKVSTVEDLDSKFQSCFGRDYEDDNESSDFSRDELKWLEQAEENTVKLSNNHFEVSLPFKNDNVMPNNLYQVSCRLKSLNSKLQKNNKLKEDYCEFMSTMMERKFAEEVPKEELTTEEGKCWYLAHHGIYHRQKNKLRVVFDCSLKYKQTSLNDKLWKGPDLSNTLVGVLMRFRLEEFAVTGDIEKMFYMVSLPPQDRNYLRFLWYPNNDINETPQHYRVTVHLFGASTSPAVANFALKKSVQHETDEDVKNTVIDGFYVDDMMKSFQTEAKAISAIEKIQHTLSNSGFNLTSFASNSRKVLDSLPAAKLSKRLEEIDIHDDELPHELTLGIKWNPERDTLGYNVSLPDQPVTKRGVLSTIFSFFDPLFIASPALVKAKRIFQIACHFKLQWDTPLPDHLQRVWQQWKEQIHLLNNFEIPRHYKCNTDTDNVNVQLHIFADGSEIAYGAVAYLRYDDNINVTTSIVVAKTRLTPINKSSLTTVPRIELNAAKLGVQLYLKVTKELNPYLSLASTSFWTDSMATLQYIRSETGRFQKYVANRVAYICNSTIPEMWHLIPGDINPADMLSRGVNVESFVDNKLWIKGPDFLMQPIDQWPKTTCVPVIEENDPEIKKKAVTMVTKIEYDTIDTLINSTSDLYKLKRRVAIMIKFITYLKNKSELNKEISVDDLKQAEISIWRHVQHKFFYQEMSQLNNKLPIPSNNALIKLNPFIDSNNLMRVGGRLNNASLSYAARHPIILSAKSHAVQLLVLQTHKSSGHLGRETVVTQLRHNYHIVGGNKLVRKIVRNCVICRKVQGRPCTQIMAELPEDRVTSDLTPFSHTATDLFGPFYVSKGRGKSQEKRYGIIFSCLKSRASHIEIAQSLDTDSFINALRRFISRRGSPALIRSDNGTNLTAANRELKEGIQQWNKTKINEFCQQQEIQWLFQPPFASHFGGVFERIIRIIRKILNSMLSEFSNQVKLTDDILATLFCEIENILNNRPLTNVTTDIDDSQPLTPNHLLRLQADVIHPPGVFTSDDLYSKRRWRQVQFLVDVFWKKWLREYIPTLIERQKWFTSKRSIQVGDIVLVSDHLLPRNMWCTGKVVSVDSAPDGRVRSAHIKVLRNKRGGNLHFDTTIMHRPVNKLVLLRTFDETEI